jgi:Fe-S oxidoreductase
LKERVIFGFDPFVIPFTLGMVFIILYLFVGTIRIIARLDINEQKRLLRHLFSFRIFFTFWNIIKDVLLHVKIFRKNSLLGYMHASIAFGWFMLILIGHIEVFLYTPQRNGVLYYPVFFRYFVLQTNETLRGAFFFFLMDFFLLMTLSGIALAVFKRFRSRKLGMKRTTRHSIGDRIALFSLWLIFPLRLLAESFTAGISGGSFLTKSLYSLLSRIPGYTGMIDPVWWVYSFALSAFFFSLPFSRYMHIPTEILYIILKNAGIKSTVSRDGYAESEIYSCSSCGLCIDACPMCSVSNKERFTSVYFVRALRNRNNLAKEYARECLMCGKCLEACPVGIDSVKLRELTKEESMTYRNNDYQYLSNANYDNTPIEDPELIYYAGCMTHLTPGIYTSITNILRKASVNYTFMDKDGSICCGRPLIISGGREKAKDLIERNRQIIEKTGAKVLLLSCPICYRVFKEEYGLSGIKIMHHSEYIAKLADEGRIYLKKGDFSVTYHDPCDLGRGCKVFEEPRKLLSKAANLTFYEDSREKSHCCGGSLASDRFTFEERGKVAKNALLSIEAGKADVVATSCPLCLKTLSVWHDKRVADISQIVNEQMI